MERFTYPDRISLCNIDFTTTPMPATGNIVALVRVSAGSNLYHVPYHLVALHVGQPVPILRKFDHLKKQFLLQQGSTLVIPEGAALESAQAGTTAALYIHLAPTWVKQLAESMGSPVTSPEFTPELGTDDPVIARIGYELLAETQEPGIGSTLYTDSLLTQLGVYLLRRYSRLPSRPFSLSDPHKQAFPKAVEFMQAHLHQRLTLEEIAAVEGLSTFHFSRQFKHHYGQSPHQYVIEQRIQRAIRLLQNPRLSVSDVALMVGFHSHSHLIRHFKRLTGSTPRAFQQEHRQN